MTFKFVEKLVEVEFPLEKQTTTYQYIFLSQLVEILTKNQLLILESEFQKW